MFSSAVPGSVPSNERASVSVYGVVHWLDGDGEHADAEVVGERARIGNEPSEE